MFNNLFRKTAIFRDTAEKYGKDGQATDQV
jgi:hypothetical protein